MNGIVFHTVFESKFGISSVHLSKFIDLYFSSYKTLNKTLQIRQIKVNKYLQQYGYLDKFIYNFYLAVKECITSA